MTYYWSSVTLETLIMAYDYRTLDEEAKELHKIIQVGYSYPRYPKRPKLMQHAPSTLKNIIQTQIPLLLLMDDGALWFFLVI